MSLTAALIEDLRFPAPDVRALLLWVQDPAFSFRPGQWVDLHVPGIDRPGGYSLTTTPTRLAESRCIGLAVKRSAHPVCRWLHQQAGKGDVVHLAVGGEVYWTPSPRKDVLVAGGIGITACWSIFQAAVTSGSAPVCLIHGAHSRADLLFADQIRALTATRAEVDYLPVLSGGDPDWDGAVGRVDAALLAGRLSPGDRLWLCGPPPMVDDLAAAAREIGLAADDIHFESWW